jgi:hypothetical protein
MEGKPFRVGEYITAGKEKGYATTYEDSRTNKKVPLPGYTTIHKEIALLLGEVYVPQSHTLLQL